MPMGASSTPEHCQKRTSKIGLEGVLNLSNDFFMFGGTLETNCMNMVIKIWNT